MFSARAQRFRSHLRSHLSSRWLAPSTAEGRDRLERTYRAAHNIGHFRYVECTEVDPSGRPRGDMASFADVYFPFDSACARRSAASSAIDVSDSTKWSDHPRNLRPEAHGIVEVRIENLDDHYEFAYRLAPSAGG